MAKEKRIKEMSDNRVTEDNTSHLEGWFVKRRSRSATQRMSALVLMALALLSTSITSGVVTAHPAAAQSAGVEITWTLEPGELVVAPNTSVTWVNSDGARHRIESTSGPERFDSGNLDPGESFSFTFVLEGTYQYIDGRNPDLSNYWGTIIVQSGDEPPSPPIADVFMANRIFSPPSVTIQVGDTVTFLNDDGRDHTVTARDGSYDSGLMPSGDSYTRTYTVPGTYEYFCAIHPDMVGTILVEGDGGEPPPPPPPPAPPPAPASGDVSVVDFAYEPASLSVTAGTTVVWANNGAALHTVTARTGNFDSGLMSAGDTFARTFENPGTYEYFCTLHPGMVGTVAVTDGSGDAPPPLPPADPPPPPSPVAGDLTIVDFAYAPRDIEVAPGTTLTWANNGVALHTVTARSGLFDSGLMASGTTFSYTFTEAGTYQYFCTLHPDMTGTVIVPSASGDVPPPVDPPPAPAPAVSGDVQAVDFAFSPVNLTVPAGSTITWVNTGVALHTATARNGSFDSGFLNTGDSYSKRFDAPGTFEYFCTLHPDMVGTVIVTADDGSAPPPPITPPESSAPGAAGDIAMLDFVFDPVTLTVPLGASVTWVNQGAALHTATAEDGSFDSGFLATGESFTMRFDREGSFPYLCTLHPGMTGTIIVDPTAPPPNPQTGGGGIENPGSDPTGSNLVSASTGTSGGPAAADVAFIVLFGLVSLGFARNVIGAMIARRET